MRGLLALVFFMGAAQLTFSQDTLFLDGQFKEVATLAAAQYLEIKKCNAAEPNRCIVARQRSNGEYLSLERFLDYEKGIRHGSSRYWYDGNQVYGEINYDHGLKHGNETTYYPNGKTRRVLVWAQDSIVSGSFFNDDGSTRTEVFKEDLASAELQVPPSFPGGEAALMQFIFRQISYPPAARDNNIQGVVVVDFVVERDGRIGRTEVLKPVHPALDKEALRIVKQFPNWTPGMVNHFPVPVHYTLPIRFKLE